MSIRLDFFFRAYIPITTRGSAYIYSLFLGWGGAGGAYMDGMGESVLV